MDSLHEEEAQQAHTCWNLKIHAPLINLFLWCKIVAVQSLS